MSLAFFTEHHVLENFHGIHISPPYSFLLTAKHSKAVYAIINLIFSLLLDIQLFPVLLTNSTTVSILVHICE